jgi:hypothetical protein
MEDVTVPAGTFKTYKTVVTATQQNGVRVRNTFWYQPGWGVAVKRVRENWNAANLKFTDETYELVSRVRGAE